MPTRLCLRSGARLELPPPHRRSAAAGGRAVVSAQRQCRRHRSRRCRNGRDPRSTRTSRNGLGSTIVSVGTSAEPATAPAAVAAALRRRRRRRLVGRPAGTLGQPSILLAELGQRLLGRGQRVVCRAGRPRSPARGPAGSSLTATMFSRRSLASLPSSLKLIRLVAMREPGGTTTMTSSSVTARMRPMAPVISSSTSR